MIDYVCINGKFEYENTAGLDLEILGDNNELTKVKSLEADVDKKSLEIRFCPAGGSKEQLKSIKEKVHKWVGKMRNGYLPTNLAWLSYKHKLWPGASYGIGAITNDVEEGEELLDEEDDDSLNFFGVAITLTKPLRKLHCTFGGIGMMNFRTEQFIARVLLLLQHYCTGSLSMKLGASLAYLQLQLGTYVCPFDLD